MKRTLRSSKSHGGCATCKARRVKCDESRPTCLICRANGVECPGYQKQIRWSQKHEKFRNKTATQPPPSQQQTPSQNHNAQQGSISHVLTPEQSQRSPQSTAGADERTGTSTPAQQPGPGLEAEMDDIDQGLPPDEWPSFDVAGFEDFGLSDFPFVDSRTPFWLPQPSDSLPYPTAFSLHERPQIQQSQVTSIPSTRYGDQAAVDATNAAESQHGQASSSGSKRFLQTYYRISQPGQIAGLTDEDFVNYFFHNVCTVISCFDSPHNKFRTLVAEAWTNSATVYLAIQSMAAGHLANHYPSLAPLGIQKRTQAWRYLQKDLQLHRVAKIPTETVLLSLLLLGPSSSWHQASNVGMQFLFIARNLMQHYLRESFSHRSPPSLQNEEFFHEALLRWEMVASFVDPVPFTALAGNMALPEQKLPTGRNKMFPHPWTGVAPEIHFAVAEVGRMLRRRRTHSGQIPGTPQTGSSAYISATDDQWVVMLEDFLHAVELPSTEDIANYEDVRTPSADLIMTADALRFVGLLEIYDVFPHLLRRHSENDTELCGFSFASAIEHGAGADSRETALTAMAMHTLETVKPIAITSAACRFLPFILLAAGCRLIKVNPGSSDQQQHDLVEARYLVEARMLLLSRKYPQKPMLQMLDIVKEVWQRLDQGSTEAHWLDVADEKGWQTLMG